MTPGSFAKGLAVLAAFAAAARNDGRAEGPSAAAMPQCHAR